MQSNEDSDPVDTVANSTSQPAARATASAAVTPTSNPANTLPDTNQQLSGSAELNHPYGALAYFCGLLLLEFLLIGIISANTAQIIALTASGLITGLLAFIAIATSLMSRNWLEGVLMSAAGLFCVIAAAILPSLPMMGFRAEMLLLTVTLPAICLVATAPLIGMRWWFGWRLTLAADELYGPSRLSIEDMILVPAALAAMFVAAGMSTAFSDGFVTLPSYTSLFAALPAMVICLIVVLRPLTGSFLEKTSPQVGSAPLAIYLHVA